MTVQEQVERFRNDPEAADKLEEAVNQVSRNLMRDFRIDFPSLPKEEYLLLLYSTTGLSTPAKCALLGISSNALYSRKSRLKTRIKASGAARADEYLSILG